MRIKLTMRASTISSMMPINYQYYLSATIYKILGTSSPEYAKFLHNHGYIGPDKKPRKLFTFSHLFFQPKTKPVGNLLPVSPKSHATLFISSPMLQDFVQHFVMGLFSDQKIEITSQNTKITFHIEQVETIAEPKFSSETKFIALSPIVLTTQKDSKKGRITYYYRPLDKKLPEAVRKSLISKHQTAYSRSPEDQNLKFEIDREYIKHRGGPEKVSKLIKLREGFPEETKVKSFLAPFTLTGSTELMKTAWECGLGDKTSMGFGCVDVIKPNLKGQGLANIK